MSVLEESFEVQKYFYILEIKKFKRENSFFERNVFEMRFREFWWWLKKNSEIVWNCFLVVKELNF